MKNQQSKQLLTESLVSDLQRAIENKLVCKINYDAGKEGDRGERIVEPIAIGTIRGTNNEVVRCWQRSGPSHTKFAKKIREPLQDVPGYRMFRLDRIITLRVTDEKFRADKPHVRAKRPKLNPNDSDMTNVFRGLTPDENRITTEYIFNRFMDGFKQKFYSRLNPNEKKIFDEIKYEEFFDFAVKDDKASFENYPKDAKLKIISNYVGNRVFGSTRKRKAKSWYDPNKLKNFVK